MKNPLNKFLVLIFAIFPGNCSSPENKNSSDDTILSNILTMEVSFGNEGIAEEYLLAQPRGIAVDDYGYMYIVDEDMVKVYTPEGKEHKIIGNPGQGPGEFERAYQISIGPWGHITVFDRKGLSLFDQDHTFLKKENLRRSERFKAFFNSALSGGVTTGTTRFIPLSDNKMLSSFARPLRVEDSFQYQKFAIFIDNFESLQSLYTVEQIAGFRKGNSTSSMPNTSSAHWDILPGNRLVYTHTEYDREIVDDTFSYTLHIIDHAGETIQKITKNYTPVKEEMPSEEINVPENLPERFREGFIQRAKDRIALTKETLAKFPYKHTLEALRTDRDFIFAFTFQKNNFGELLADIFDTTDGRFLRSVYFPKFTEFTAIPDIIKDGYAYKRISGSDILPKIQKYKINPEVYKK